MKLTECPECGERTFPEKQFCEDCSTTLPRCKSQGLELIDAVAVVVPVILIIAQLIEM